MSKRTCPTHRCGMGKAKSKYRRCKKCRELVNDPDNCANCANRNPLGFRMPDRATGKRGSPTLDIQEGNPEGLG